MKLLLLLLLPVSVVCQDSSLVKWNAKKRGKSPTDISIVITADIKKGYFLHPCESCSFNDWNDTGEKTEIQFAADSNWAVKLVFSKNKYRQKTRFYKEKIKDGTRYYVDCRVYGKMKLFRGIELTPSDTAIARYTASIQLQPDSSFKNEKQKDKLIKDASKTLANTLTPPKEILLTFYYKINDKKESQVIFVPNTYKSKKVWGWKKTPRRIVNKETAPVTKTEDK